MSEEMNENNKKSNSCSSDEDNFILITYGTLMLLESWPNLSRLLIRVVF